MNWPKPIPKEDLNAVRKEWELGGGATLEVDGHIIFLTKKIDWKGNPFFACGEGDAQDVDHHVYAEVDGILKRIDYFGGCGNCVFYKPCTDHDSERLFPE